MTTALSTLQAAKRLGVSRYVLYRLVRDGHLDPVKLPGATGSYVFDTAEVEALAAERAS